MQPPGGDQRPLAAADANNGLDDYEPLILPIEPAIQLPSVFDRLELTYQGNVFDQVAVVYLRATGG